jgi:hypothetical protein
MGETDAVGEGSADGDMDGLGEGTADGEGEVEMVGRGTGAAIFF